MQEEFYDDTDTDGDDEWAENDVPALSPAGKISFIRDGGHELATLQKNLNRTSKKALLEMAKILRYSKDEKLKMETATRILDFTLKVSKELNTDAMQRAIAEIKYNSGKTLKDIDGEDGIIKPLVNFNDIQDIN